ncbi:FAD binding domain-containing protein [Pyrenophora tritici-repentis]|uniref:FAD binding domain-containing protein n=1 Tax=Pyrenophora tritici-repentis TaxID=45151 RepID=A0A922NB16_9PLEO|nr:FAD binding domain-containing protein [Pyrenophora tritici-repentis]
MFVETLATALALFGTATTLSYQDPAVTQCCSQLAAQLPNTTFPRDGSSTSTYYQTKTSFWSATEWLDPTCVFLPTKASDIEAAVSIFTANDCPFAIRGGGHSAIRAAANIDHGILVSMKHVKDITFSEDLSTVTVGAGLTWAEVYEATEARGRMAVAGRFGTVGTGLVLGAGFSYLNNRHGLGVDNVAGQHVVLANGTSVYANATHHSELHWALKGGGNNFGVVSHYDLVLHPSDGCFGGRYTYPHTSIGAMKKATYDYHVKTAIEDVDMHVLPTYVFADNTTYGYTPVVSNRNATALPKSLRAWDEIPHTNQTMKPRKYGDLANHLVAGFPDGLIQSHYTFTVYPDEAFFGELFDLWGKFCISMAHIDGFNGLHTVMPITPRAIAEGIKNGHNALGIDQAKPNTTLSVFYLGVTFNNAADSEEVFPAWETFVRSLQVRAKVLGILFPYIMMNYSDHNQQVLASYGAKNVERLQAVQRQYDPSLVFQRLVTGGQKLPL